MSMSIKKPLPTSSIGTAVSRNDTSANCQLVGKEAEPAVLEIPYFQRLKAPIWVFDIDRSCVIFANTAACQLWNAKNEQELTSRNLAEDMSTTVKERLSQYQHSFCVSDKQFSELWTLYPKGKPVHVNVVFSGHRLDDGRMAMLCEVLSNFEEEPETIRSVEALLHTSVMITLYSADGRVLYTNPSSRHSLVDGKNVFNKRFISKFFRKKISTDLENSGQFRDIMEVQTANGIRWHKVLIKSCSDAVTGNDAMLVSETDVTAMKSAQEHKDYLATHDPLTGLHNRSVVQNYIENPQGFQQDYPNLLAVLYIDIDHFKNINDVYGHEAGDATLVMVAKRLKDVIRGSDAVVRLGGDEFLVILNSENHDHTSILDEIAKRIRLRINEPIEIKGELITVSCSIGIAKNPTDGKHFEELIRHADLALYEAKNMGRKNHCYFKPSMSEKVQTRMKLESDLCHGLENDEFILHYQPRVDIKSGQIVAAEALVRWHHPQRGLVMPGDFIPFCEDTGQIEQLGELVLKKAASQQAAWAGAGHPITVSVNISPRQFHSDRLLPLMRTLSKIPGVDPSLLELEITENVLIGNSEQVLMTLAEIQRLGFHMALDDFGTGYSNLVYILDYPIKCIKIDKSFIGKLPQSNPVVKLIVSLGKQIEARVVAEGVETPLQLQTLRDFGCDEYQGFLFQKPRPSELITNLLENQCPSRIVIPQSQAIA